MPATAVTAAAAAKQVAGREDVKTIFQIVVFTLDEWPLRPARHRLFGLVSRAE
jgi:hypothetical protein